MAFLMMLVVAAALAVGALGGGTPPPPTCPKNCHEDSDCIHNPSWGGSRRLLGGETGDSCYLCEDHTCAPKQCTTNAGCPKKDGKCFKCEGYRCVEDECPKPPPAPQCPDTCKEDCDCPDYPGSCPGHGRKLFGGPQPPDPPKKCEVCVKKAGQHEGTCAPKSPPPKTEKCNDADGPLAPYKYCVDDGDKIGRATCGKETCPFVCEAACFKGDEARRVGPSACSNRGGGNCDGIFQGGPCCGCKLCLS